MAKNRKLDQVAWLHRFIYLLIAIFFLFLLVKSLFSSLFFSNKDRVNILVYDKNPRYFSFSESSSVNYTIGFNPETRIKVPGGYSFYRVGALGWLQNKEKKPNILRHTFSSATSSFVDFYFYKGGGEIYYASRSPEGNNFPTFSKLFFYKSNANIFDRLYLFLKVISSNRNAFTDLDFKEPDDFSKVHRGYLYQKTYRMENKSVGIIYTKSYTSAANISNILEGNGIKVVDLTENKKTEERCHVIESGEQFSQTAKDMADFFSCALKAGNTATFDIILELGKTEEAWEVE